MKHESELCRRSAENNVHAVVSTLKSAGNSVCCVEHGVTGLVSDPGLFLAAGVDLQ